MQMSIQPNEVVLSFRSHRARNKSGIHMDNNARAVYSFSRASYGYYRIDKELATRYRSMKGVSVLRGPYDDIRDCWMEEKLMITETIKVGTIPGEGERCPECGDIRPNNTPKACRSCDEAWSKGVRVSVQPASVREISLGELSTLGLLHRLDSIQQDNCLDELDKKLMTRAVEDELKVREEMMEGEY